MVKGSASISIILLSYFAATALAGAQAMPRAVRVSRDYSAGLMMKHVPPEYPVDAKKQRIEGTVVLQVEIDRQGNVTDAKVVSGHRALVASAIDAVKQWKYHPYMINGEPFPMQTKVEVPFTLPK
jgi:protein TonB